MEISTLETFIVRFIICAIIAIILVNDEKESDCGQDYCYSMDNERTQNAFFSSKTPYFIKKGPETNEQFSVSSENFFFFLKMYLVIIQVELTN